MEPTKLTISRFVMTEDGRLVLEEEGRDRHLKRETRQFILTGGTVAIEGGEWTEVKAD